MKDSRFLYLKNTWTSTFPMFYHETGSPEKRTLKGAENFLPGVVDYILNLPEQHLGCPEDLTIVTWNNYPDETILEKTCNHLGIPIQVYGKDIKDWTSNYEKKIRLMYDACCQSKTKYILGIDSRDLVFLTSPTTVLNEFKKMNIKMLFGGTIKTSGFYKGANDLLLMFRTLPGAKFSIFRNLNGGQWIADREYAKSFFEKAMIYPPRPERPESDQIILSHTLCYNKELRDETKIDYNCRIFQIYTNVIPLVFFYKPNQSITRTLYEKIDARIDYWKYILERNRNLKLLMTSLKQIKKSILKSNIAKRIRKYKKNIVK